MHMLSLGNAFPRLGVVGKGVAFDDRDLLKMLAQHTRSQQSTDAAADHDRVFSQSVA